MNKTPKNIAYEIFPAITSSIIKKVYKKIRLPERNISILIISLYSLMVIIWLKLLSSSGKSIKSIEEAIKDSFNNSLEYDGVLKYLLLKL